MLVIEEFKNQMPDKVVQDYNVPSTGYGTNAINSRRDSLALAAPNQSLPSKLLARNSLSLAKSNVGGGSRGHFSLKSGANTTSSQGTKERQALMYQQVLRETAS